ncbi:TIR domain-containing protein [Sphingomonas lutea]|uniref:TIR domain-containing protein n=1 Tax=Sphingomonas lutea TaxID=1045317 RepID=A0A7G9SK03_9SPHN|nr:TIR domain-containing protein [Sphingomonas lutea]QNN68178.1 TIR domain-containing protein [Sphingomonas lutea]
MADVFLSCARTNLGAAQRVAALLRACGFSVWYDESLPAHRAFSDVIEEQLEAASSVLVLWSTEAVASQWVRSEANRGREKHRLVQVRLDDARLPMPFDQLQCVDLRNWNNKPDTAAWESVVASVAELAGREASGGGAVPRHLPPQGTSRRQMLVGGGVVAGLGALGGAAWLLRDRPKMSPEAQMVLQKGLDSLQQNDALETQDPGSTLTAIALLSDATQLAPDSAVAWGGLAMAYAVRKRVVPPGERRGVDARSRAAAKAALELDPREGRATGALRMLEAPYRNWIAVERGHRAALQRNPTFPILLFTMSDLLGHVGRWQEARQYSDRFDRKRFMLPGADRKVIINLWAAGDLPAADRMLDVAVKQWPQHPRFSAPGSRISCSPAGLARRSRSWDVRPTGRSRSGRTSLPRSAPPPKRSPENARPNKHGARRLNISKGTRRPRFRWPKPALRWATRRPRSRCCAAIISGRGNGRRSPPPVATRIASPARCSSR